MSWYIPDMIDRDAVPDFQLYGEANAFADPGFVHIETIASRSRAVGWEIRPHAHSTLDQLLIVRTGAFTARMETERYGLSGPAIVHVPASTVHGFDFSERMDGYVLTFSAELRAVLNTMYPDATHLPARPLAMPLGSSEAARIFSLVELLIAECTGRENGWIAAAGWTVGLLLQQVGRMRAEAGMPDLWRRRDSFRTLVDRHYRKHRPLSFYAGELGMTERSLTRLCRKAFGCSPTQYLHRRLLLEAKRHLVFGSSSIASISADLGFSDASYFNRFYRRLTGKRPSLERPRSMRQNKM